MSPRCFVEYIVTIAFSANQSIVWVQAVLTWEVHLDANIILLIKKGCSGE